MRVGTLFAVSSTAHPKNVTLLGWISTPSIEPARPPECIGITDPSIASIHMPSPGTAILSIVLMVSNGTYAALLKNWKLG
jgi:hypothetical protein